MDSSTSQPPQDTPHVTISDEQILAGEQEIIDQVAQSSMLVSIEYPLFDLESEYMNNPHFLTKIAHLQSTGFHKFRRCRPDGNCFYRALIFGWFERIINNQPALIETSISKLNQCKKYLVDFGFQLLIIEDFYESAFETLLLIQNKDLTDSDLLLSRLQLDEISNGIVVLFRLFTSAYLQVNQDEYLPFVLEFADNMAQFCSHHVEATGRDADHIHILAISKMLELNIAVAYLDSSDQNEATIHRFDGDVSDPSPQIHLLYRPGHFDLLYKD